ncbi:MAG: 5'-methylthioadenosine/S-adenosylhomocysteine nucleosidase [Bacteroidales bacterium]|nr:5'-methylthioadenosine/S-adenosylhomocysteine nucleosidase [Bacteroidales bacterium]
MNVGLIVAMSSEYDALQRAGIKGVKRSGIGKVSAARLATEMILTERPDCIINSGCAGALSPGMEVFDVVVGAQTAHHDVWCGEGNLPGQVQGLPQRFDADPRLLSAARSLRTSRKMHFGLICSGERFFESIEEDAKVLANFPDALAVDMESAAIAQVCLHYGVPFLSFRLISDVHTDATAQKASYENFWKQMGDSSYAILRELLERL